MLTIDADAHVIECEKTWDYLEGDDKRYRPVPIAVAVTALLLLLGLPFLRIQFGLPDEAA